MSDEIKSITVAEARAAVQASGLLESISAPEFMSTDPDISWRIFWSPKDGMPEFAMVTVQRQGQKPREVVISWAEYADQMDADPEWDQIRASKPMSVFGAECERHAYRVVFADILTPLLTTERTPEKPAPARDYSAEIAAAQTDEEVHAVFEAARNALAADGALMSALQKRKAEIAAAQAAKPAPARPGPPQPRKGLPPSPAAVARTARPLTVEKRPRRRGKR